MTVSVIITVYNLERYIEKSIHSVLDQSYKNIEIILVDDCSTDHSAEIINKYSDRLTYLRTSNNSGVLLATIEGLKKATGDIICFLDGDDLWHKNKIQKIVEKFEIDEQVFMVSHNYQYINDSDEIIFRKDHSQEILIKNLENPDFISQTMKRSILGYLGNVWLGSAYCIKNNKSVVDKFILWAELIPDSRLTYQDHPLACFWVIHHPIGRICYIGEPLLQYRIHDSNYSGSYHNKNTARKIAVKAYNTALATQSIVAQAGAEPFLLNRQNVKVNYYKFLITLMDKKFFQAFRLNIYLTFRFYKKGDFIKEWVRFWGILFLGDSFFKFLNNR
jgi:glycosyltransferase involved in cell wall biosynthesis